MWVEIAIKKHTHKTKNTRVQPKNKRKNETAIDSSRHRQLGERQQLSAKLIFSKKNKEKVETRRNKKNKTRENKRDYELLCCR